MKRLFATVLISLIALLPACDLLTDIADPPASVGVKGERLPEYTAGPDATDFFPTALITEESKSTLASTIAPITEKAAATPGLPYNDPGSWGADFRREYAHPSGDRTIIGTDESLYITVTSQAPNLSAEDFAILYDNTLLAYEIIKFEPDNKGRTWIEYRMWQIAPGRSEIKIRSEYEFAKFGENCSYQTFTINGLDYENGRLVYYAPEHGTKYHFDPDCTGKNSTPTTLYDALHIRLGACKKCAQ